MASEPARFIYTATPTVVPYTDDDAHPSVVQLLITVSNPPETAAAAAAGAGQLGQVLDTPCDRIVFDLPVGPHPVDLTDNPEAMSATVMPASGWTVDIEGGRVTVQPRDGDGLGPGMGLALVIDGLQVNDQPGAVAIGVSESTDRIGTTIIPVTKIAPGLAITGFTANPVQVSSGDPVTLAWASTGAQNCTLAWDGQAVRVSANGTKQVTPEVSTTYTLTASAGGMTTPPQQVTVFVPVVEIVSFDAAPVKVAQGGPVTLTWLVRNADTCAIEPGDLHPDPAAGHQVVTVDGDQTYLLVAKGEGLTRTMDSPRVTVQQAKVVSFTTDADRVVPGGKATLQWQTEWTTGCTISNVGEVAPSGTIAVSPKTPTDYALTAVGLQPPPKRSVTVDVWPDFTHVEVREDPDRGMITVVWTAVGDRCSMLIPGESWTAPPLEGQAEFSVEAMMKGFFAIGVLRLERTSAVVLTADSVASGAIRSFELDGEYGLCAPGASVHCRWDTDITDLTGTIEALGDVPIAGATGEVDFIVGPDPDRERMPSPWDITAGTPDHEGQLVFGSLTRPWTSPGGEQGPSELASLVPDMPWRAPGRLAASE